MNKKPIISFQVEQAEAEAISRYLKQNGIKKRSPFLREAVSAWIVSDQPQLREKFLEDMNAWRKELHGVGSNLNQVAWRLNSDHPLSTEQIIATLDSLQQQFKELTTNLKGLRNDLRT